MIKQQAFNMPFENMFTHQTNILIFEHDPKAEARGILLIKIQSFEMQKQSLSVLNVVKNNLV
jgi:hypothetical protein